jgi:hypothetical protein
MTLNGIQKLWLVAIVAALIAVFAVRMAVTRPAE